MTFGRTASTHTTEPLEKITFGKRYYVVDDQKHVWGADLAYEDAAQLKEKVAGALWSKTPTVKEMPKSSKLGEKLKGMVRGPDNVAPPKPQAPPAPTAAPQIAVAGDDDGEDDAEVAELERANAPAGNGHADGLGDELDDDDDLDSLLNA
jgi:hypothetical protein